MTLEFPSIEFDNAIAAVCHGCASESDLEALRDLLLGNPAARDEYLIQVELHTRLASDPDLFSARTESKAAVEACGIEFENSQKILPMIPAPSTRKNLALRVAMAACVVLAAVSISVWWFKRSSLRTGATTKAVAMLTRVVDAHWGQKMRPLKLGSALEPGLLRLDAGLAQVVFYSGARVVIDGPSELRLVSPSEAILVAGKLLAEVPPPARGFRIKTESLNVVDHGTEFGVQANHGRTEVHVFEGNVEVIPDKAARQSLTAGQAAVVQRGATLHVTSAASEAFASMFECQKRSLESEAVRYDEWRLWSAQLNEDPSLAVHFDFENLGDSEWKLRNAAENMRPPPEGAIVGCQQAQGRWREKQALEFQSVNDRVRLSVPGELQAMTLSTWICVKGLDRQFNSLFMCDGFDAGTVHWLIRNDGVLGLTLIGSRGRFQILVSPPVITVEKLGTWMHLAVVLDGQTQQAAHYVNGELVSRHALKFAAPFRIGSAELGNWNAGSGPEPRPLAIRNLSASLDEFELFNRALSDSEIHDLFAKGKPER